MIFLLKYWQLIVGGIGVLILGVLLVIQKGETRHWHKQSDQNLAAYNNEHAAFASTVANYKLAYAKAQEDDAKNLARVKAEQSTINERTVNDYQTRIAATRSQLISLRSKGNTTTANSGGSGTAAMSNVPTPTCGTDAPTLDPVTRAFDCAIQLDELITSVDALSKVEVNGTPR